MLFTCCDFFCDLFVLYNKTSNGLLKILRDVWGMVGKNAQKLHYYIKYKYNNFHDYNLQADYN